MKLKRVKQPRRIKPDAGVGAPLAYGPFPFVPISDANDWQA